ncbi:MAG: carboxylating nicotinate-nucleotide diphosphorylase [Acidimicrobiia bacterium]
MSFDAPRSVMADVVAAALAEDIGLLGDITSIACIREDQVASAVLVAREEGVVAGTALVDEVYRQVDPDVEVRWHLHDGDSVELGSEIGEIVGPLQPLLTGERVALNFLCHCSGIATTTRRYVRATRGKSRILDTRKTLPGLRAVQRAAVRAGGGFNHRDSLSTAVLIKDNHLAVLGLTKAVDRARARWPMRIVEVECDTLEQVRQAREAGVDVVLVDNMSPDEVRKAVEILDGVAKVEVSGGVTLDSVGSYAETGADFISVGAITNSVRVLDIGLDLR